ncbi:hypothetical protein E0H26_11715 [Micromonospora zingiberis]|uniref:Head-to-tail adaptor n=1 Tax=Micromonospora zingiberis TaxID=2053011 RepID=A0A4R0GPG5_9ACTN|nr:hypothetical protein [Micromonospora zingiberis]TCB97579.1 hypothetical protein E0H26_11715 [Micromonospora zingiberis]
MAYATPEQLADYPVTVPAGSNAELLLRRASRDVDQALLCAVYDPEDPAVVTALMEATCEQVAGILDSGDRTGTGAAPPTASFSIGKVSVVRGGQGAGGSAAQASRIGPLWPQAWQILQAAGLTGHGPQTW